MRVKVYTKISKTQDLIDLKLTEDQIMILRKRYKKRKKLHRKELMKKVKNLYKDRGYRSLLVSNIHPGRKFVEIGDLGEYTIYAPNPDWR